MCLQTDASYLKQASYKLQGDVYMRFLRLVLMLTKVNGGQCSWPLTPDMETADLTATCTIYCNMEFSADALACMGMVWTSQHAAIGTWVPARKGEDEKDYM